MRRTRTIIAAITLWPAIASSAPVVELFTSQGCYSCPPADEHLAELIEGDEEIVALEFHVDYWDNLRYGSAGVWKDPFSSPAYSDRQRAYNQLPLKGKQGVYTPQMVVNGVTAEIGGKRSEIQRALNDQQPFLEISTEVDGTSVAVELSGNSSDAAQVWLAVFDRSRVTQVLRGENHGKTMRNHHVVREFRSIAPWRDGGDTLELTVPALSDENTGCAILVQNEQTGQIIGAAYC